MPHHQQLVLIVSFVLAQLASSLVSAADLSGQYFGIDRAQGRTLHVEHLGSQITGKITGPDWHLEFSGSNDGSNMANVGVTLLSATQRDQRGFMIMRWQPTGMQVSLIIKTNRAISGQYHFSTNASPAFQTGKQ